LISKKWLLSFLKRSYRQSLLINPGIENAPSSLISHTIIKEKDEQNAEVVVLDAMMIVDDSKCAVQPTTKLPLLPSRAERQKENV
jgi:hypothetical protein